MNAYTYYVADSLSVYEISQTNNLLIRLEVNLADNEAVALLPPRNTDINDPDSPPVAFFSIVSIPGQPQREKVKLAAIIERNGNSQAGVKIKKDNDPSVDDVCVRPVNTGPGKKFPFEEPQNPQ